MLEKLKANIIQINLHGPNQIIGKDEFVKAVEANIKEFNSNVSKDTSIDLIAIESNNSVNFLINLFTVWKLKKTALVLDSQLSQNELQNVFNFYGPQVYLKNKKIEIITTAYSNTKNIELEGIALILLTSGTTGTPKGVKISFDALISKIETMQQEFGVDDFENSLNFLPMSFGHGLIANTLFPMFTSKNFYFYDKLDLNFINYIEEICISNKINFFSSVPSFWRLLQAGGISFVSNQYLKRIHSASANLNSKLVDEILNSIPNNCKFFNVYGITEMASWVGYCEVKTKKEFNRFQFFKNVQSKFCNNEVFLKAPFMFSGYLNLKNSDVDEEGYFKTGDIFENECLISRLKDLVNKGGVKIYLNEIDELILSSNFVKDVVAVRYFLKEEEMLGIIVVMKEGYALSALDHYLKEKLTSLKWPSKYIEVNQIERNARGKINREALSKEYL